jgi:dCMP deaminase
MKTNKHKIFLDVAEKLSEMSYCISHKVGCILVKDGRIISTGYNGTPAGFVNCNDVNQILNVENEVGRELHHKFSETFEIHAEINAILCAAKNGICIDGSILYSSLQPCNNCLKMICNSGIKTVIFRHSYDKFEMNEKIKEMLDSCNVQLISEKDL